MTTFRTAKHRIALAAALGVLGGGCDALQSMVGGSSTRRALGEVVTVAEFDLVVQQFEDPFVPTADAPPEVIDGRERLVAVEVELRNDRQASASCRPGWFHLYDQDGHAFDTTSGLKEPRLRDGYIQRGEKARGWVTFQIPAEAKIDYIQFFAGYLDGRPASVELRH